MPKRTIKSPEFGKWVREARLNSGKSQHDIAKESSLKQQYWSKMEGKGLVPRKDDLAKVCKALGKSLHEVQKILGHTTELDDRTRTLQDELSNFEQWLIGRAEKQEALDKTNPVRIFVIRDDSEPDDEGSVEKHRDILSRASHLHIAILFRYSRPDVWTSFQLLGLRLEKKWVAGGGTSGQIRKRISGYFRDPNYEEVIDRMRMPMPMAEPVFLVVDASGRYLFCYGTHPQVYQSLTQAGNEEDQARIKSITLLPASAEKAALFAAWIGPELLTGISSKLWHKIEWPDEIDDSSNV